MMTGGSEFARQLVEGMRGAARVAVWRFQDRWYTLLVEPRVRAFYASPAGQARIAAMVARIKATIAAHEARQGGGAP